MYPEVTLEEVMIEMCRAGTVFRRWDYAADRWRYFSVATGLLEGQLLPSLAEQELTDSLKE